MENFSAKEGCFIMYAKFGGMHKLISGTEPTSKVSECILLLISAAVVAFCNGNAICSVILNLVYN